MSSDAERLQSLRGAAEEARRRRAMFEAKRDHARSVRQQAEAKLAALGTTPEGAQQLLSETEAEIAAELDDIAALIRGAAG